MSKLCLTLPPLAPDYSGAASALFDLGGMIVIHDASGCTGNYVGYEEPRWFNSKTPVFCSGLRHMDAILGTDDVFMERVLESAHSLKPKFIAVLGSPVPMVIGTDFDGIASELENRSGLPCFGIATNGLHYYGEGYNQAIIPLIKRFANKYPEKKTGVNILGVTPIDFSIKKNDGDFKNLFESNGISVIANYCMGLALDEIEKSSEAALNIVVSQSGVGSALYMYRQFGIPFIVQTPIGTKPLVLEQVKRFLAGELPADEYGFVQCEKSKVSDGKEKILIVGDQIISLSIRDYLRSKGWAGEIKIASLFDTTIALLEKGDYAIRNECQLRTLFAEEKFSAVVADPLVFQLIRSPETKCIPLHHPGVSGRLSWDSCPRFMSEDFEKILART